MTRPSRLAPLCLTLAAVLLAGCASNAPRPLGEEVTLKERRGQEFQVAGRLFNAGTPVVLMTDPGGMPASDDGNHYGQRKAVDDNGNLAQVRDSVDQFVYHFDVCGISPICYQVLEDRGLSVHFMCDADGTVYQSVDLSARAWHATKSNGRSIGVEIAQIGAYAPDNDVLDKWYSKDAKGKTYLDFPDRIKKREAFKNPPPDGELLRPVRNDLVDGNINKNDLVQYDFTPQQYDALIKLTAALHEVFPAMALDYPRDAEGNLRTTELTQEEWLMFHGILGHYHVQEEKNDPGPAFDFEKIRAGATALVAPGGIDPRPSTRPATRPSTRPATVATR